jgi:hypothetical protein
MLNTKNFNLMNIQKKPSAITEGLYKLILNPNTFILHSN